MEVLKTYVNLYYPGFFFPETKLVEVKERNPVELARSDKSFYAFQYFDRVETEITVDGKTQKVYGDTKNMSPMYYPDGMVKTVEEIKALNYDKKYDILIANANNKPGCKIVFCRKGNSQFFEPDKDEIIIT